MDTVPAIEDQLNALQPICSAQRVSTGITCGAPAVVVVEVHAIDECNQMGLSPDGDLVETLCQACLATVRWAMATYVGQMREMASRCGTHPVCATHDPTTHRLPVCGCGGRRLRGTQVDFWSANRFRGLGRRLRGILGHSGADRPCRQPAPPSGSAGTRGCMAAP